MRENNAFENQKKKAISLQINICKKKLKNRDQDLANTKKHREKKNKGSWFFAGASWVKFVIMNFGFLVPKHNTD